MRSFFIIWQDEQDRRWWPVARLVELESCFVFVYTKGAKLASNFRPFPSLTQLEAAYVSRELFPFLANRVFSKNRPDFRMYSDWSGIASHPADPLLLMGTMGGARATDKIQVYPVPEMTKYGGYETTFFCHGISHLPEFAQSRVDALEVGDLLFPMLDAQNPFDQEAVALRTGDPTSLVGYCPRHLCFDIRDLINKYHEHVEILVAKVNYDAPTQFRLLCRATSKWPLEFDPCDREVYQPLVDYKQVIEHNFPFFPPQERQQRSAL